MVWASVCVEADTVLSVGRSRGAAGTEVEAKVQLSSTDALVGVQIDFGYDPQVVNPGTPRVGASLGSTYKVAAGETEPGRLRVVLYSETNRLLRDGNVLVMPLTILGEMGPGERGLEVLEVQLADAVGRSRTYALTPFVEIITPGTGGQAALGADVGVEVEAYAAAGELQSVQLFVNGELAGTRQQAPYTFTWKAEERGTHDLLVVASDSGTKPAEAQRSVYILSNFDNWKAARFTEAQQANPFVGGMRADPDHDGLANALEYLTGGDPLALGAEADLVMGLEDVAGALHLTLSFNVSLDADDIQYTVFAMNRPGRGLGVTPQAAQLVEEVPGSSAGLVRRTYRDPQPVQNGSRFMFIESTLRP